MNHNNNLDNPLPQIMDDFNRSSNNSKFTLKMINARKKHPSILKALKELEIISKDNIQDENDVQNKINLKKDDIRKTLKEVGDLFVLNLWATFERWLRNYLQTKGQCLKSLQPSCFGNEIYTRFEKDIEFWKPKDMLDICGVLLPSQTNLIGQAKPIIKYRDWVAHGKNIGKEPTEKIYPEKGFIILNEIIKLIIETERDIQQNNEESRH